MTIPKTWRALCFKLGEMFEIDVDLNGVLLLIGMREMEYPFRPFSKEEKLNLVQLGSCTLYTHIGWTRKVAVDRDGWPVFEQNSLTPSVTEEYKTTMLQNAAIKYFEDIFAIN